MQYCICCIQDFLQKESINVTRNLNSQNLFKTLFTQGMVCRESYKDKNGNWLYPDEIEKINL